ncbi:MAG: hypothetical protein HQL52_03150 [Magnetococcales bacterium]|nr:hypothetical protein [Magnetococcales bacterium]
MPVARLIIALWATLFFSMTPAGAHHILGRPSYSLNSEPNTPPSMQLETRIGDYLVTLMAFPAFPQAGEESWVKLSATHLDHGEPFLGRVIFSIRDDLLLGGHSEKLGEQRPVDGIYRQGVLLSQEGNYVVTARFEDNGEPYTIEMPLRIGQPLQSLPLLLAGGGIGLILLALAWRKQHLRKIRQKKIDQPPQVTDA